MGTHAELVVESVMRQIRKADRAQTWTTDTLGCTVSSAGPLFPPRCDLSLKNFQIFAWAPMQWKTEKILITSKLVILDWKVEKK